MLYSKQIAFVFHIAGYSLLLVGIVCSITVNWSRNNLREFGAIAMAEFMSIVSFFYYMSISAFVVACVVFAIIYPTYRKDYVWFGTIAFLGALVLLVTVFIL